MEADLAGRIASLALSARRVAVELAAFPDHVTRARARLATVPIGERGNLTLDAGETLIADIANDPSGMRAERRQTRLHVTDRTSPHASGRAELARRLDQPIRERSRFRNRALIKDAAQTIWHRDIPGRDWLLVYEVSQADVGVTKRMALIRHDGSTIDCYRLHVPHGWRGLTMHVGNGTQTVSGALILGASPVDGEETPYRIHEVIVAAN